MQKDNSSLSILNFLFEVGHLKQLPRSGWFKIGINAPESIGEHSFRTAIIGYILAKEEGVDVAKTTFCCLFHDLAEARTSDLDWLAQNYFNKEDYMDNKVLREQISGLPDELEEDLAELLCLEEKNEEIQKVVRDADLLEAALQGIEYTVSGNEQAVEWIKSSADLLRTSTGKSLGKEITKYLENDDLKSLARWWSNLMIDQSSKK